MQQRSVLITGGSSGIGAELVRAFANEGHRVWFTYHRGSERADALLASLPTAEIQAFPFELSNPESQERLLQQLPGPVDILVNNAGLGSKTVAKITDDIAQQDAAFMMVNVVGTLWLTRQLLPAMEQRGFGKVILLSSVNGGVTAFPRFHLADGMSKAALAHLGRQLQALYSRVPIDIYTVCPGATETPMFEASTLAGRDALSRSRLIDALPGRRLIAPAEIARLVVWLCKDDARLLRGAVLDASLGLGTDPRALWADDV